jgi:hypothetical protein
LLHKKFRAGKILLSFLCIFKITATINRQRKNNEKSKEYSEFLCSLKNFESKHYVQIWMFVLILVFRNLGLKNLGIFIVWLSIFFYVIGAFVGNADHQGLVAIIVVLECLTI